MVEGFLFEHEMHAARAVLMAAQLAKQHAYRPIASNGVRYGSYSLVDENVVLVARQDSPTIWAFPAFRAARWIRSLTRPQSPQPMATPLCL